MNWTTGPQPGDNIGDWGYLRQFRDAVIERPWGAGRDVWPRSSRPWESGTVPSNVTETSFADGTKTWCTDKDIPWTCTNKSDPDILSVPTSWRLVIDDNDPAKVVISTITSWTTGGTLNFENIRDFVTSGHIPDVSSLIGKRYFIIRGGYGLWWSERVMPHPNAYEWATGTVQSLDKQADDDTGVDLPAAPTHALIRDPAQAWRIDEHVGRELLVYGDDAFLHRVVVTANTKTVLSFAAQSWTPAIGSAYVVVAAGGRAYPGRSVLHPFTFYTGVGHAYATHTPDDETGAANLPERRLLIPGADAGGGCDGTFEPMWDYDYWTGDEADVLSEGDALCGRQAGKPYGPHLHKSIRAWQMDLEDVSQYYVEAKSYDGATSVPFINPAKGYELADVNAYAGTTGNVEGAVGNDGSSNNAIFFSGIVLPYYPIEACYSIAKADGDYKSGYGLVTAEGRLLHETSDLVFQQQNDSTDPVTPGDNGRDLVLSTGWSRYVPREFRYMYDQGGVLVPDVRCDGFGACAAVDPPDVADFATDGCLGIGTWVRRPDASTHYVTRTLETQGRTDPEGFLQDSPYAHDAYAAGDLARYLGDNFADPSVRAFGDGVVEPDDEVRAYWDRFFVGRHPQHRQNEVDAQREGVVTSGTTFSVSDASKDWYDFRWFGGVARTEEGVFTSGSTTSGSDSSKAPTDPETQPNCAWKAERFVNFASPWEGFVVEVLVSGTGWDDPAAVVEKRLITSGTSGGTVSWSEPLSSSASGKSYRIPEPYKILRYVGRTVTLTSPDAKSTHTAVVTGNGQDTIFFSPAATSAIGADWAYQIDDPQTGTVWKWDGSAWVKPTGADSARLGVLTPADFHPDQRENLPSYVKRYGRFMVGDAVTYHLFRELWKFSNVLLHVRWTTVWTYRASSGGASVENLVGDSLGGPLGVADSPIKHDGSFSGPCDNFFQNWDDVVADFEWYWTNTKQTFESDGGAPFTYVVGGGNGQGCYTYMANRRFAWQKTANPIVTRQAHDTDFYARAEIDADAHDASSSCPSKYAFDGHGAPLVYRKWALWDTVASSQSAEDYSTASLGSLSHPHAIPAYPGAGFPLYCDPLGGDVTETWQAGCNEIFGYAVTDECAVLRWDVTNGFVYRP